MKKYNKLPCGCKYAIDNYEDNFFCRKHKSFLEIREMIAEDVRRILLELVFQNH